MRGTDPTKSKWECPTMFYAYYKYNKCKTKLNKKGACALFIYLFVIVDSVAIFYLIYVLMYKPKYNFIVFFYISFFALLVS